MADDFVRIEGKQELLAKIRKVEQYQQLMGALMLGGAHLKGKLQVYPPVSRRPQPFKTDKQRRGFFAKLRKGEIRVPYVRGSSPGSRNLKQQWTVRKEGTLRVVVGNSASAYNRLVQDKESQTRYHRQTGWITVQEVAEQDGPVVGKAVEAELQRIVGQ